MPDDRLHERRQDDQLVSQLYEAAAGLVPWPVALSSLAQAFDAMVVQYVTFDVATRRLVGCEQPEGMVVDAVLEYMREYSRIDPHVRFLEGMPLGTAVDTEDAFPAHRMRSHPFYRDFWLPHGVRGMLTGKIDEDDGRYSCIGIVRSSDRPRFTAAQLERARSLVHHLVVAFRVARQARSLRMQARLGLHLMEQAHRPMLLIDRSRRILAANAAAHDFLASSKLLAGREGHLEGRGAAAGRAINDALAALDAAALPDASSGTGAAAPMRRALRLEGRAGEIALCALWKLPGDAFDLFADEPAILVSIAHPLLGEPPDATFVAAMLDLTPAEARLACQLVLGHDLVGIAARHAVSINTVKSQIRAIYAKTGTRRQSEVVRLISRACAP